MIASGGAGEAAHLVAALTEGGADAALLAGILHDGVVGLDTLERALAEAGLAIRRSA